MARKNIPLIARLRQRLKSLFPKSGSRRPAAKGPNQRLRQRSAILIIIILVFGFGATLLRLGLLTVVQGSDLQEKAVDQQLADTVLTAKRGTIYDVSGNVLAESAAVWQVVMSPINFEKDEQREAAARGLSDILGVDYDNVLEKTRQSSYYTVVKRKVEAQQRDQVIELINTLAKDYNCGGVITLLDDYKRYYPHNDLASNIVGFTGADEQGLEGVEYQYDSYLSGTPGRIVTAQNARGTNMPFAYEQNIASKDGDNIYLTIDQNIQQICEKYMAEGIVANNVLNKGVCIAMDVHTGAIKAMVISPGYDLNNPYTLTEAERKKIDALPEKEQDKAEAEALSAMWRNKAVADTYMPGSVFKMCTASMALEEGAMSPVDFAVASFGQNFGITPIQMITACSAVANGGYVLKPYVVSKITDSKGNVVKNVEKKVKRQVISKNTSDKMNEYLGYNTQTGGANVGYVAGYRVGGKTGTSEKIGVTKKQSDFEEDYIASFCGYAPADDPQIAMLVFFDTPSGGAYYGSQVASPVFINIMSEVLPYLEIKTDYSDIDEQYLDVTAGDYTGLSVEDAMAKAAEDGFTVKVKGEGDKVISQIPNVSAKLARGGKIVFYTTNESRSETVMVPDFQGKTAVEANALASENGLNLSFKGAVSSGGVCTAQSMSEGTEAAPGTVVTLTFSAVPSEGLND